MPKYLLDTSIYSQPLRPCPDERVMARWEAINHSELSTSAICHGELLYGLHKKDSSRLWDRYHQIFERRITIINLTPREIDVFARLKSDASQSGRIVDTADLLIAATAIANKITVVTLNTKHFRLVPSLLVEDWSVD